MSINDQPEGTNLLPLDENLVQQHIEQPLEPVAVSEPTPEVDPDREITPTPPEAIQPPAANHDTEAEPAVESNFSLAALQDSVTVEAETPILKKNSKPWDEDLETLVLPTDLPERTAEYTTQLPNIPIADTEGIEWLNAIKDGNEKTLIRGGFHLRRLKKEGSKFKQFVRNEHNQALGIAAPRVGQEGLSTLTGTHAIARMRAQMNMGHMLYVPLWHSGFWLGLRAPNDQAVVDLFTRIEASKIDFGRSTYGISFANGSVFYAQELFNFAVAHIVESTLKDPTPARMEQFVKQPDYNAIVTTIAALIWPDGFQYTRPIFDAGGKERKMIKDKIDIRKTLFTDTTVLTPRQIQMMNNRTNGSVTDEMIESYQNEFADRQGTPLKIGEKLWAHFKIPTMKDYFNGGQNWVNGIIAMTQRAFSEDLDDNARNDRITLHAQASNMRQYSHWVDKITLSDDPQDKVNTTDKREVIDEFLADLSGQDEVRDQYFIKVREFIDDKVFTIAAIPAFDEIEIEKTKEARRFPYVIPMDPAATFFTLLVQKIRRISQRL